MFSIGEFSKITGLSVKTLRFYHEKEVLVPSSVDPGSGYRYYDQKNFEKARVIAQLRELDFSLNEINVMLEQHDDEADILDYLQRHKEAISERVQRFETIVGALDRIIQAEREASFIMQESTFDVEEKLLDPVLIAGIRMQARYEECGQGFGKIGKKLGRYISGKAMLLHYDDEYKEQDADFEACMPIREAKQVEGISVRELPGGRCVSLLHKGPYDQLGRSYAKILAYINQKGYKCQMPSREVYLKCPGMIFKGNPKKYLTEIQFLIEDAE